MNYQIAIPTYGRSDAIRKFTLKYLESSDVPRDQVTLFVANADEKEKYEDSCPDYQIVVGVKGLCPQRQFISRYYDKGTPVFSFDDDVSAVETLKLAAPLETVQKPLDHPCSLVTIPSLDSFIQEGFSLCEERGIGLWGCYAVRNKGFLHAKVSVGLKFVMGHGFGFYAGDPAFNEIGNYQMKDDFYLSLWHFENQEGSLVFSDHCIKSKAHSGSGGTNADMEKKLEINNETVDKICARFPELASVKMRRTKDEWLSRYKELRLKVATTETISTLDKLNSVFT